MHSKPRRGLENELVGSFCLFSEHQAELSGEKTSNWEWGSGKGKRCFLYNSAKALPSCLSTKQRGRKDENESPEEKGGEPGRLQSGREVILWMTYHPSFIMDDLPSFKKDRLLSGHLLSVFSIQSPQQEEMTSK